jgi:hypothetical protein
VVVAVVLCLTLRVEAIQIRSDDSEVDYNNNILHNIIISDIESSLTVIMTHISTATTLQYPEQISVF